jgi:4-oxalocrotonate tautomerase
LPLVTLSLEAGRTREQKLQLADGLYETLGAAIQIPENDRFLAVREHAAGDLIADPEYLGVARSEHPVFVEITLRHGRPVGKKQALYREIAERMSATGVVRAEDLLIVLHENDLADWSFGNGVAQYVVREEQEREQKEAAQKQGGQMSVARISGC